MPRATKLDFESNLSQSSRHVKIKTFKGHVCVKLEMSLCPKISNLEKLIADRLRELNNREQVWDSIPTDLINESAKQCHEVTSYTPLTTPPPTPTTLQMLI